jgi:hypothetical protein
VNGAIVLEEIEESITSYVCNEIITFYEKWTMAVVCFPNIRKLINVWFEMHFNSGRSIGT